MSSRIISPVALGNRIALDPDIHNQRYMIAATFELIKSEKTGEVIKAFNYTVFRNIYNSPLIYTLGQGGGGEAWEVVRGTEYAYNLQFENLMNRLRELYFSPRINCLATFELLFDVHTVQVSHNYMQREGFDRNVDGPWRRLYDYYHNGTPMTRRMYKEMFGIDLPEQGTGFEAFATKVEDNTRLDVTKDLFPDNELRQAEDQATILDEALRS